METFRRITLVSFFFFFVFVAIIPFCNNYRCNFLFFLFLSFMLFLFYVKVYVCRLYCIVLYCITLYYNRIKNLKKKKKKKKHSPGEILGLYFKKETRRYTPERIPRNSLEGLRLIDKGTYKSSCIQYGQIFHKYYNT